MKDTHEFYLFECKPRTKPTMKARHRLAHFVLGGVPPRREKAARDKTRKNYVRGRWPPKVNASGVEQKKSSLDENRGL